MDDRISIAEGQPASGSILDQIGKACGAQVTEHRVTNQDGEVVHAFGTMSFPLRKNHWIYDKGPTGFNTPPMVMRMGSRQFFAFAICDKLPAEGGTSVNPITTWSLMDLEQAIRAAGKYAVRCATMNGAEEDFDPDALLQNLSVGFLGYATENGLSKDEWANPTETWKPVPVEELEARYQRKYGSPAGANEATAPGSAPRP